VSTLQAVVKSVIYSEYKLKLAMVLYIPVVHAGLYGTNLGLDQRGSGSNNAGTCHTMHRAPQLKRPVLRDERPIPPGNEDK
jgi:hypothetical protein